ncbi:RteC domain-containing protein [Chitinophaga rhizosphaerae]|uniref:RteC domain-containing protein n=1 Tax=Chitinophaga rhizosphaerae TaxID=1864947 RepID=UPI001F0C5F4C|nr:RteC domain-containing protein [Chitinophaga rhizosphaerae]
MINQTVNQILETLLTALDAIDITQQAELPSIIRCAELSQAAVKDLQSALDGYTFADLSEEIHFFKSQQPQLEGRLIYYVRLSSIMQLAPVSDIEERRSFFKSHLVSIEQFYREHAESHLYYRMEYTHLDKYYFSRDEHLEEPRFDGVTIVMDNRYHTRKSNLFAHFFAMELLSMYLNTILEDLSWDPARRQEDKLIWTGTQAEATELLYALNEAGVFNRKKQDIRKVASHFERSFGIKFSNIYATNEDNRMRKKDQCAFLNHLIKVAVAKYDYDDEHAL